MSVLTGFIKNKDDLPVPVLLSKSRAGNVTVEHWRFYSQRWPIHEDSTIPSTKWAHKLFLYIPDNIKYRQALLYVNGGLIYNKDGNIDWKYSYEKLNFTNIAYVNSAIVADLQHVPNQYLMINGTPKAEDVFIAYTYKRFIETNNPYILGHLPMAKSIIRAMDAIELLSCDRVDLNGFVLVGASKRGWAVWLAAIEDARVKAIIPIVSDLLNTQKVMMHICNEVYKACPPSFDPYKAEGIDKLIGSSDFNRIMQIEDPLQYISDAKYKVRMQKLDKYIINASGDDFFVPDSSHFYFDQLPGRKHIRYLPNAMHSLTGNSISDALGNDKKVEEGIDNYFHYVLNSTSLPGIEYKFDNNSWFIKTTYVPEEVILWSHNNWYERDFRCLSSYSMFHLMIKRGFSFFRSDLCDRHYDPRNIEFSCANGELCEIKAYSPECSQGWQASFVEMHYNIDGREFVISTEVDIKECGTASCLEPGTI